MQTIPPRVQLEHVGSTPEEGRVGKEEWEVDGEKVQKHKQKKNQTQAHWQMQNKTERVRERTASVEPSI